MSDRVFIVSRRFFRPSSKKKKKKERERFFTPYFALTIEPCLQFTQTQVFSFPNSDFQEFTYPDSGTCCFHRFIFTIQFLIPREFFFFFFCILLSHDNTWQLNSVWSPEQTFPFLNSFPAKSQHHTTFLISETIYVCLFFSSALFQNHLM